MAFLNKDLPIPEFYPYPANPLGFMLFNKEGFHGTVLYLHGRGGIGYGEKAGLEGLVDSKELPHELILGCKSNGFRLVAPRCDSDSGWNPAMIDKVMNHAVVKNLDTNTFHGYGFSWGAFGLGTYLATSAVYAGRFATALICYTTQILSGFASVVAAKTKVVGITANDSNPSTKPIYTQNYVNAINNAGANPRAIFIDLKYGDHGGALLEVNLGKELPELGDKNIYDYWKTNGRGVVVPPVTKSIKKITLEYSDGTVEVRP